VDAHAAAVIEALNAGCHVITEKPMAMSVDECRAMLAAAKAAGKTLAVDFESRVIPHYRRIRSLIDQGMLGAVRAVHIDHFWDGHKPVGELGERRKRFLDRSGCLDCGIHKIDLARYFSGGGAWRRIHAVGSWFGEKTVFPPHIAILATLDNGVMATINASFAFTAYIPKRTANPNFQNLAIVGEKGVIVLHHTPSGAGEIEIVCEQMSAVEQTHPGNHKADIAELLSLFASAVQRGDPLPAEVATGYDGLMAQICMDEANRQAVLAGDASIPAPSGA